MSNLATFAGLPACTDFSVQLRILPIVLGGDGSVPIPFMRAYEGYGPLTVIQVDAHLDWRHEVNGITEGFSNMIAALARANPLLHA